ncbi:MAG: hypothetical protein Q8O19_01180, partial [Rectinemataceae bacterium]|nr:hypothetical protein [Rectinemataceae bacterium]
LYSWLATKLRRDVNLHPYIKQEKGKDGSLKKTVLDPADQKKIAEAYNFLGFSPIPKVQPKEFRMVVQKILEDSWSSILQPDNPVRLLTGLNAEGLPGTDGFPDPTVFSFSNGGGGQYLFKDFLNLVSLVSADALRFSLEGNPGRSVWCTSLNWDPRSLRSYAHQWSDPESFPKETDVAANALAFIGLASFPVVQKSYGNRTVGYSTESRALRWPLWEIALPLAVIDSLIATLPADRGEAKARGASVLYESNRFSSNKRLFFSISKAV